MHRHQIILQTNKVVNVLWNEARLLPQEEFGTTHWTEKELSFYTPNILVTIMNRPQSIEVVRTRTSSYVVWSLKVGKVVGLNVGTKDGDLLGLWLGRAVGVNVGSPLGDIDGIESQTVSNLAGMTAMNSVSRMGATTDLPSESRSESALCIVHHRDLWTYRHYASC